MRLVVIGCGFAGVEVVGAVRGLLPVDSLEIVMIDPRSKMEFQAAHPEILSGKVLPEDISGDIRVFSEKNDARFVNKAVETVDLDENVVKAGDETIPYDFLVIASGGVPTFFGVPGAETSYTVNTLSEAVRAKNALDRLDVKKDVKIAVIGAGLTGVEVVGELNDYFNERKAKNAKIYLVEAMDKVLPTFNDNVSNYVRKLFEGEGVEIVTSKGVERIDDGHIVLTDGSELDTDMVIWTCGIQSSSLSKTLGLENVRGWIVVDENLRAKGRNNLFVIGDAAHVEIDGILSGKNVEEAEHQGRTAAQNIVNLIRKKPLKKYRPVNTTSDPRAIITLGRKRAVIVFKGMMIRFMAYRLKKFIEHRYLKRFRSRKA